MYCPKCKRQVLGDICPDCGYKSAFKKMDDLGGTAPESPVAVPVVPGITTPMKDKPAAGGFKPMDSLGGEAKKATVNQDIPASGGFKPMGVLPSGEPKKTTGTIPTNTGDVPAAGGFKPMNPLNIPSGHNTTGGTKVPATGAGNTTDPNSKKNRKPENDRKSFSWKRWMIVVPVCCVLVILLAIGVVNKSSQGNGDALQASIENYIQNEMVDGEALPLMLQYQNAVLDAITYEVQKSDLSTGTMDVEFTYIDVLELADSIADSQITEDEYYSLCIERINTGNYKTITEIVKVHFEPTEDGCSVIRSDALINVLSGGALNYYMELLEEAKYE